MRAFISIYMPVEWQPGMTPPSLLLTMEANGCEQLAQGCTVLVLVNNLQSSESNTQMMVVARYFGDMIRLLKILNESASAVSAGSLFQAELVLGANELRNASVEQ